METTRVTEWLKLMLEEIRRKQSERADALRERGRRAPTPPTTGPADGGRRPSAGSPERD